MLARHLVKQAALLKNAVNAPRSYHVAAGRHSTMNDLPVPKGDWQEHYTRKNSRYNTVLLLGIGTLVGTIALVRTSGIVQFNFSPPKSLD